MRIFGVLQFSNQADHFDMPAIVSRIFDDFLGPLDNRDHDRKVLVQVRAPLCVAFGAVTQNAAIYGRTADIHHAQALHDGVVERFAVPEVRLAEVHADRRVRAVGC